MVYPIWIPRTPTVGAPDPYPAISSQELYDLHARAQTAYGDWARQPNDENMSVLRTRALALLGTCSETKMLSYKTSWARAWVQCRRGAAVVLIIILAIVVALKEGFEIYPGSIEKVPIIKAITVSRVLCFLGLQLKLRYLARKPNTYRERYLRVICYIAVSSIMCKLVELLAIVSLIPNSKIETAIDVWNFLSPILVETIGSIIMGLEAGRGIDVALTAEGEVFVGLGDWSIAGYLGTGERNRILGSILLLRMAPAAGESEGGNLEQSPQLDREDQGYDEERQQPLEEEPTTLVDGDMPQVPVTGAQELHRDEGPHEQSDEEQSSPVSLQSIHVSPRSSPRRSG